MKAEDGADINAAYVTALMNALNKAFTTSSRLLSLINDTHCVLKRQPFILERSLGKGMSFQ